MEVVRNFVLNLVNGVHGLKDLVIGHVEEGSEKTLEENLFKSKTADIVLVEITESKAATLSNAQFVLAKMPSIQEEDIGEIV